MIEILLALSLIPVLAIVMVVHEGGHFLAARMCRVKATAFSIGFGPALWKRYTGATRIATNERTLTYARSGEYPEVGEVVSVFATVADPGPDGAPPSELVARAVQTPRDVFWFNIPRWLRLRPLPLEETLRRQQVLQASAVSARINGRLLEVNADHIVVADMEWKVGLIPLAAYVALPEDPSGRVPGLMNVAPWRVKFFIAISGIAANIALALAIAWVALMAPASLEHEALVVTAVAPDSPAARAGLSAGDRILGVDQTVMPDFEDLKNALEPDRRTALIVQGTGRDSDTRHLLVSPDPESGRIGATLETRTVQQSKGFTNPLTAAVNTAVVVASLGPAAGDAVSAWREGGPPPVMSVVGAADVHQQYVSKLGWTALPLMLALVSGSIGVVNALPILPMDGGRIVLDSAQSLRGGRPLPERVRLIYNSVGLFVILYAGIFLIAKDALRLSGVDLSLNLP